MKNQWNDCVNMLSEFYEKNKENYIVLDDLTKDNELLKIALFNKFNNTISLQFTNPEYICIVGRIKDRNDNEIDLAITLLEDDFAKTDTWIGEFSKTEYNVETAVLDYRFVDGEYEVIYSLSLWTDCSDSELLCRELINRDKSLIALCRKYLVRMNVT